MNVYDSDRMADVLAPLGYAPTARRRRGRPGHPQHLPHPREGAEKVYSELGRLRDAQGARAPPGRDLMIAVAGCVAQAEGEEIIRRAPRSSTSWSARRPTTACPSWSPGARRAAGAVVDTEFPAEDKFDHLPTARARRSPRRRPSSPSRKAATSSAPSASCPTRAAPRLPPGAAIVAEARRLVGAGGARDHAARPERQRLSRRGPGRPRLGASAALRRWPRSRARAAALHHQPSARHGRRPDRRPWRPAGADALPAPAGAVGLRPHPRGDEPRPHRGRLPAPRRALRARGPTSRCRATSSSASPARPSRFRGHTGGAMMEAQLPESVKDRTPLSACRR
jgi:hypothetical protein